MGARLRPESDRRIDSYPAAPAPVTRVTATFGFMEAPNVPRVMELCAAQGLQAAPADTSYYLGHERLIPTGRSRMPRWRKKLFVFMSRNALSAAQFFGLPPNRVVELGAQIEF